MAGGASASLGATLRGPKRSPSPDSGLPASFASVSVSRLLAIAKDHETICSRLMDSTRTFEDQLRTLRAEHELLRAEAQALRTCLDRAGVVPAVELDKELAQVSTPLNGGDTTTSSLGFRNRVAERSPSPVQARSPLSRRSPSPTKGSAPKVPAAWNGEHEGTRRAAFSASIFVFGPA
eukprot:TRINITY_DN2181_c0_g1_i1.p1 TRINITY_DN2181_c0_g1~~TRINITY_DN2181_c0_g1_i1.p1  ORF type:complete len:200 (-),score=35.92 TRINITY_DN2181_c0_g1_i1:90-623(-)